MGLRINTNVTSLSAQRSLGNTIQDQASSMQKLSSGSRIVRAADDAAGLAISEKMWAKIRSTGQAERNANDGISLIQTAEGGLTEINNILIRLRELGMQSASDTVGDQERQFTNLEYQNLKKEIERILSLARDKIAKDLDLIDDDIFAFCWIVDYPMFERNEITNETSHNGVPVWRGRVCTDCNLIVTQKRIENINKRLPRDHTIEKDV